MESAFEVTGRPVSDGIKITSNLNKVSFAQQSPNMTSGIPSHEGEKGSIIPKVIDLTSTDLRILARLANTHKQKYGFFAKLSLELVITCEVAKNPHIFLTRANQHIQ